jgi:predicted alpha/beta-hydrolase family hydrolase
VVRTEPRTFADGGGATVSAIVAGPDGQAHAPAVVLAHGAGSDMHSALLVYLQGQLADAGYASVRFNFPYKEQGRRIPDRAPVLERCFRSVLAGVRETLDTHRLVIGGKSMGGRMATHLAADGEDVDGLILLGYPLHPAQQPERLRVAHLPRIAVPMLFFAGTRDALCNLDLLRETFATLRAPATLHIIEDGDHSFAVRRGRTGRSQADVYEEIAAATIKWLDEKGARDQGTQGSSP